MENPLRNEKFFLHPLNLKYIWPRSLRLTLYESVSETKSRKWGRVEDSRGTAVTLQETTQFTIL